MRANLYILNGRILWKNALVILLLFVGASMASAQVYKFNYLNSSLRHMRINKLIITYMNGTQKVLNRNMLRFNTSDDED